MQSPAELGHAVTADRILLVDPEHTVLVGIERHWLAVTFQIGAGRRKIVEGALALDKLQMHQPAGSIVDVDGGGWCAMGARWIGPNTQKGSTIRRNATPIMRGAGYGQAVTLRRGCFAHVSGKAVGRCARASLKARPLIAPGPLLSKAPSTLERMSILAAAFRNSTALGVRINVALTRWIHPVAFVGTAALARPCSHAFFMFRFLARGSAGTDVSFTGRAGRGLALSRRNKRRAEERRNDQGRDCKFGSHQKSPRLQG